MSKESTGQDTAPVAGKPGLAKAGSIILYISLTIFLLPLVLVGIGIVAQMTWLEYADTTKEPHILIQALPWMVIFIPLTSPVGIVGGIIGWLMRRSARKG